ncbi:general secretion pathway protein C [Corallococcus coralloides DSM 2259]|uniref:General secretion pathway protein C n=1 Tax=Corallococcus coralloides (strain ATCC 25202 / DSM 2259 / NBRC 100086 / M2) TaxID=1144275 RepID=H8MGE2_CORCM|nr:type II secretion system protein GspC [Corallococcus coralloides]AFE05079.1 general secretion pathway protein C [Corallococcus coralloides DSM 2259]
MNRELQRPIQGLFVLLVFACALTAALIVNQVTSTFVLPGLRDAWAAAPVPSNAPPLPALDGTRLAQLTGLSSVASVALPPEPPQDLRRSTLGIRLLGTLVAQDPRWSMASIHELPAGSAHSLMVSDIIQGARVFAIERERILLLVDGRLEYVDGSGSVPPVAVNVHPGAAQPGGSSLGRGIRETGPDTYAVPREDVTEALTHLNELSMQARVVPAFKDGRPMGFKLFSIREESFYSRLGLRNGDVLQRINGLDLDSPDKALEAFTKLRDARRIELQIERGGAPVRKTFDVQ